MNGLDSSKENFIYFLFIFLKREITNQTKVQGFTIF